MARFENPKIPEGINVSPTSPVREFLTLTGGVIGMVVALVIALGFLADWAVGYIPFSYEQRLAATFAPAPSSPSVVEAWLQEMADQLAASMGSDDIPIIVSYADIPMVNAHATLGGHIVIYRGLLEKIPHENALAMVVAHEIAHIKRRHPIRSLGRGVVIGLALAMVAGSSGDTTAGWLMESSGGVTGHTFSREQEDQADGDALRGIAARYGHVAGGADLFRLLGEESSGGLLPVLPEFLSTHPDIASRIEAIDRRAERLGLRTDGATTPIPDSIVAALSATD